MMNKFVVSAVIVVFFGFFPVKSQEQLRTNFIGPSVSIDWGYRLLQHPENLTDLALVELKNETEFAAIGYSYGVRYMKFISDKFSMDFALKFVARGYDGFGPITNQGIVSSNQDIRNFYYFNYIDIPIGLDYYFHQEHTSYFIGVQTAISVLHSAEHRTVFGQENGFYTESTERISAEQLKRSYGNIGIRGGLQYAKGKQWVFRFEPALNLGLTNIRKVNYKEHLYSALLQLTIFYNW
jgi:hypothetical protein